MVARLLIVLLLLCSLACAPEDPVADARSRFEAALAEGDLVEALAAVEDLESALPDSPDSSVELARAFSLAGETSRAVWLLESAVERHPEQPALRVALAEAAGIVGDPELALRALADMPMDAPRAFYAMILRGRNQIQLGGLAQGLATLEAAEARFPDRFFEIRVARVQALMGEQRHDDALALVEEARRHPDLADEQQRALGIMRADVLAEQDEHEAALAELADLIAERPSDDEAWRRRAELLMEQERTSEARIELSAALDESPDHLALYPLLSSTEQALGNAEGAEAALRELVERDPSEDSLLLLAEFLHQQGRSAEGASLLGEAVERAGDEAQAELRYLHVALLLSAGEEEAAHSQFAKLRRLHPRDPRVEYLQARFELARGDLDAAVNRLKKVASRLDRSDVQHWLGVALERQGNYEAAEFRYGLATMRDENQTNSYLGLIRTFERRAMWGNVLHYASIVVNRAPDSPAGYDYATRALIALGRFELAERAARIYLEHFPDAPDAALALAQALRSQGRAAEALVVVDETLRRDASDPRLIGERAVVLGLLGRGAEGLHALDEALAQHPDAAALPRARAYLLFMSNRRADAEEQVEQALRLDPEDPAPLRMTGDFFSGRGEFAAAVPAYERYLERRPLDPTVLFRLAIAYDRAGDSAAAIAAYQRTVAADEKAVAAYNNLALVLQGADRLAEALAAAQQAYSLAPGNPQIMDTLGWLYVLNGKPRRGVALLEKATSAGPISAETRLHLALAYRDAGETDEARTRLETLREELDPSSPYHRSAREALAALQ